MCPRIQCGDVSNDDRWDWTWSQWTALGLVTAMTIAYILASDIRRRKRTLEWSDLLSKTTFFPETWNFTLVFLDFINCLCASASLWRLFYGGSTIWTPNNFGDIVFSYEISLTILVILCVAEKFYRDYEFTFNGDQYRLRGRSLLYIVTTFHFLTSVVIFTGFVFSRVDDHERVWERYLQPGCERNSVRIYEASFGVWTVLIWIAILRCRFETIRSDNPPLYKRSMFQSLLFSLTGIPIYLDGDNLKVSAD